MRLLRIWLLVVVLPTIAGCLAVGTTSSYDGPEPPEEEIAILEGFNRFWVFATISGYISSIDGKDVGGFMNLPLTARLSPGYHCIELTILVATGIFPYILGGSHFCDIGAQFEAGHRYHITGEASKSGEEAFEMETTYRGVVTTRTIKCGPCVPKQNQQTPR